MFSSRKASRKAFLSRIFKRERIISDMEKLAQLFFLIQLKIFSMINAGTGFLFLLAEIVIGINELLIFNRIANVLMKNPEFSFRYCSSP